MKMRRVLRVARMGKMTDIFKVLAKDLQGRQPFAKLAFDETVRIKLLLNKMWGCKIYSNSEA
jgi:hypothetical protein